MHGSIGVHLITYNIELMSHITGAVVQTPLTVNKNSHIHVNIN
jgi:hypothetical protein